MKKLVTAVAACVMAGAVFAVESVNIVGYSTINVPAGSSIVAPSFTTVGGDATELTLGMITPSADFDAESLTGGGTVQFINADGSWGVQATYWANYGGWYITGTETLINDTVFPKGGAVYVSAAAAATFMCAGEIGLESFAVTVPAGSSQLGNCIPAALTLGDITPSADFDAESLTGGGTVQFINADGSWGVQATYWTNYGGWYITGTETLINDTPLTQGLGFYVSAAASATFTYPSIAALANP